MRSAPSILACALVLSSIAQVCFAGPTEDEARAHTKAGTAAFNLGHYDEAVLEYEAAYKAVPAPVLLYNIGQANRLGGNSDKALIAYKSYLRTAPANAPNREQVEKHIEALEAATWTPGAAPKQAVPVAPHTKDLVPKGEAPSPSSRDLTATTPTTSEDSRTKDLTPKAEPVASPGTDVDVSHSAAPEARANAPMYKTWWFWTGVGAVAVAGVTTAVLLSRGQQGPIPGNVNPPVVVVR